MQSEATQKIKRVMITNLTDFKNLVENEKHLTHHLQADLLKQSTKCGG